MKKIVLPALLFLAACEEGFLVPASAPAPAPEVETLDPAPPPPPPPEARTVEQFDTTSAEDRQEAIVQASAQSGGALGTTIATLGPPADPGIWIKTPLVGTLQQGRADYAPAGTSISVELRPSGGDAGSGSQISLAAMRLLEIPLTALAEIALFGE